MPRIQNKRGLAANLPSSGMLAGELFLTTDRSTAHFALDTTTQVPIVPAIDMLNTLASINGASDYMIMHDADGVGVKEKKILPNDFKNWLNIPAGSSDEQVAVVAGGASGYIWGTNGTDGILRMNTSMTWSKDADNAFVTLAVGNVDCGTF